MTGGADLAGARVLVTGATGFIGRHVVDALLARDAGVLALTRSAAELPAGVQRLGADLVDGPAVRAAVAGARPDLVLHLAAATHVGRSFSQIQLHIRTNVEGTTNLLQALDGRFSRFVHVGSGDVYGTGPVPFREDGPVNPVSPYAVSKYAAERFSRMFSDAYGWPIVCLRPFNVYGPGQSPDRVIPELITSALRGRPVPMTGGRQTREFTYIDDLVDALLRALVTPGASGEVVNIGTGEELAIADLAAEVIGLVGRPVELQLGALPYRPNEIWRMFGDPARAAELLDWKPAHPLREGLRRTIAWYREQA